MLIPLLTRRIESNVRSAFDSLRNTAPAMARNRSKFFQIVIRTLKLKQKVAFDRWLLKSRIQTAILKENVNSSRQYLQ